MKKKSTAHKNDLFDLIHSLTKSEKRYFKVFSKLHGGQKNYIKLFDAIEKQKKPNEDRINKKFADEPFARNIHVAKKYLFDFLLRSMQSYHGGKTVERELNNLFQDMEFLHEKGLTKLRDSVLRKIKKKSNEYELYELGIRAFNKEWTYNMGQIEANTFNEHTLLTKKIIKCRQFNKLANQADKLAKKGVVKNSSMKKEWTKIIKSPVMNNKPSGYREKHYFHQLQMFYFTRMGNFEKSSLHAKYLLENLESKPEILLENKVKYFGVLVNLISELCQNKELKEATEAMSKLLQVKDWTLNIEEKKVYINYTALAYCNLLAGYTTSGNITDGLMVAERSAAHLLKNIPEQRYKLSLLLNLSIIYLIAGNFKEARKWNTILLNDIMRDYREDVHVQARVLNLIIHYELKNDDLLPYLLRSTYRFLCKRIIVYKTENAIMRFIRNTLPKADSVSTLIESFKILKIELKNIAEDPTELKALESFDFIAWLDSKIENRSFADIVRERAMNRCNF